MSKKRLSPKFEEKDSRRIDLIMKKHCHGGLTEEEILELSELNDWVTKEIYRVYPPNLESIRELEKLFRESAKELDDLLRKLQLPAKGEKQ